MVARAVGAFRLGVRLEDLTPGALVRGLVAGELASVVQVEWYGESTLNVTYRTGAGEVGDRLLFRSDEPTLAIAEPGSAFAFDGDPALYRLVSEARRIHLAHLFDPMLAVASSAVEPLPHQITAVYREMLPRQPLRFLLADDPGAGKTIMARLYIQLGELLGGIARHLLLVTATPHAGKEEDFQLFLALLDADRFEGRPRTGPRAADATDLMRRMVKEKLLRFDGTRLFPSGGRTRSSTSCPTPNQRRLARRAGRRDRRAGRARAARGTGAQRRRGRQAASARRPALRRAGDGGPGRHAPEGECFHRPPGHAELPGAQTAPAAGQR